MKVSKDYKVACQISEEDLHQLDRTLTKVNETPQYELTFEDNISYDSNSISEIVQLIKQEPNLVESLNIKVSNTTSDVYVSIKVICNKSLMRGISYYSESKNDDAIKIKSDLEKWIYNIKVWYSFITKIVFLFAFPFFSLFVMFLLTVFSPNEISKSNNNQDTLYYIFIFLVITFGIGLFLDDLKLKIFPIINFNIGYGLKRYNRLVWIHNFIALAIITPIIVTLLLDLIF